MVSELNVDIVNAAKSGDADALDTVLRRSRQNLRRYAEYHCEVNDVEDAVQESLYTVSRRLGDLRQVESIASWLFRIIKRECNRMRRGWRLLTNQEITPSIEPIVTPEPTELRIDIGRAMVTLPSHYREILLMRDVSGLTLNEIAGELGLELAATKSRLHRARALMRERLGHGSADLDCT